MAFIAPRWPRRVRVTLSVRLAVAFIAVIALGVGTVALLAGHSGTDEFRSYVAARGYGPADMPTAMGAGMMGPPGGAMPAQQMPLHMAPEEWFLDRLGRSLWTAAAVGGVAALAASLLIARRLAQPARALQRAARRMAAGDLNTRVEIRTGDEFEEVGQAFNQMAESLERQEQARRALVADVAHDLRTPVAVIQGTVDAMLDGVYEPAPEHLRSIREETERLGRLVGDLRDLSLTDAGQLQLEPAPVNVAQFLGRVAARAQRRGGSGVRVRTEIDAPLPVIHADETRLAQALDNLLENALRYTPADGTVTLTAHSTVCTREPEAEGRTISRGPAVTISVEDSGPGISPEHLPHVFERFYRADGARSRAGGAGSGLGLAIVRSIVAAHGGEVRAANVPGRGARFSIMLPDGT